MHCRLAGGGEVGGGVADEIGSKAGVLDTSLLPTTQLR